MRMLILIAAASLAVACTKKDAPEAGVNPGAGAAAPVAAEAAGDAELGPVESVELAPSEPKAGETIVAKVEDSRGRLIHFTWYVDGEELVGEHDDRLSGKYVKKGGTIKVSTLPMVDDAEGESKDSETVTVGNTAPKITSVDVVTADGGRVELQVRAEDVDGDPLQYRIVSGPDGMSVDGEGRIAWTAPEGFAGGVTFAVGASDGDVEYVLENSIGQR